MPVVAGAIATFIVGAGASAATIAFVTGIVEVFLLTAANLLLNSVMRPNGRRPGLGSAMEVNYYSTEAEIRLILGYIRVGGMETIPAILSSTNGDNLNKVLTLAGHEVDSFDSVYFDQDVIQNRWIAAVSGGVGDGLVSGTKYNNHATIRRYKGTASQTADWKLVNEVGDPFTSDFRGRGIAYGAITLAYGDGKTFTHVPTISFDVNGALYYDPRLDSTQSGGSGSHRYTTPSTWVYSVNPALALAWYLMHDAGGTYDPATELDWPSFMAAANVCAAMVVIPDPFGLPSFAVAGGTASFDGTAYMMTKASGIGAWDASIRSTTSEVPDEKPYITAVLTTPTKSAAVGFNTDPTTNNSYTSIDYCIILDGGGSTFGVYENGVQKLSLAHTWSLTDWVKLDCDGDYVRYFLNGKLMYTSALTSTTSALFFDSSLFDVSTTVALYTAPRFTTNGMLFAAITPDNFIDSVQQIVNSMLGKVIFSNGVWSCYAGGWATPTFTIQKADWVSPLSIRFDGGIGSRYNRMHAWYIDPHRNWQKVECLPRTNAIYKTNDGNRDLDNEIDLLLCTNEHEAQRSAEFMLRMSRNQIVVTGRLPPRFQNLSMWETGTIVIDEIGWSSKTFRISQISINADGSYDVVATEEQSTDWTDLTRTEYSSPSTMKLPAVNVTMPSEPASFAVAANINGTLLFTIGTPIIKPLGTRYQIIRSTNSANAAAGTVVWEGTSDRVTIVMPVSRHTYYARALVDSYYSAYQPNTFGLFAAARPEVSWDNYPVPDGDIEFSNNNGDYWITSATNVFSLSLTGGITNGRIIVNNPNSQPIYTYPKLPFTKLRAGWTLMSITARAGAINSPSAFAELTTWIGGWTGVGTPNPANTYFSKSWGVDVDSFKFIPLNTWVTFPNSDFLATEQSNPGLLHTNVVSYPYLVFSFEVGPLFSGRIEIDQIVFNYK